MKENPQFDYEEYGKWDKKPGDKENKEKNEKGDPKMTAAPKEGTAAQKALEQQEKKEKQKAEPPPPPDWDADIFGGAPAKGPRSLPTTVPPLGGFPRTPEPVAAATQAAAYKAGDKAAAKAAAKASAKAEATAAKAAAALAKQAAQPAPKFAPPPREPAFGPRGAAVNELDELD